VLLLSGRQLDGFPLILLAIDDLTDRRERDLRLAAIVESSEDAILSKTLNGTMVSWNSRAERIYGYAAHEMIGQPISVLAPPGHEEEMSSILKRIRRGEKVNDYETKRRRRDGEIIDVSVAISPNAGRVTGASTAPRDITELNRRQHEALPSTSWKGWPPVLPTTSITCWVVFWPRNFALTESWNNSPVVDDLQEISSATIRGVEIIRKLSLVFESADISLLIGEVLQLLEGKETVDAILAGLRIEHFIRKPFQLNDLMAFLQGALASRET
jgi:PAS domain S-box-containing protein